MDWFIKDVKEKYFDFNGRAHRTEFWMYILVYVVIAIVLAVIDRVAGLTFGPGDAYGILSIIFSLALLLPTLGVGARRLHDTGKSGWLQVLLFIPCVNIIGIIVLIIIWAMDGNAGPNAHGEDPKVATA